MGNRPTRSIPIGKAPAGRSTQTKFSCTVQEIKYPSSLQVILETFWRGHFFERGFEDTLSFGLLIGAEGSGD